MPGGEDTKLYKIGEVCRVADVQPYVLRYWETEFPPLTPNKSGGGQRMYTAREIEIILRIKQLLYTEGFTIAGAKKKLELELSAPPAPVVEPEPVSASSVKNPRAGTAKTAPDVTKKIASVKRELKSILALLDE